MAGRTSFEFQLGTAPRRPRPDDESAMRILVLGDFSARAQRGTGELRLQVHDATGRFLIAVTHRDDLHKAGWTQSDNHLTEAEAEVLAGWIARLPMLMRRPSY